MGKLRRKCVVAVCAAMLSVAHANPAAAQFKAALPDISEVPPETPAAIDGVWKSSLNGVDFRIQAGRAYALTSFLYLFIFTVESGMVSTKNIRRLAAGIYEGYDMPTLGPWKARLRPDNTLAVTVNGPFGPIPLTLTPIQVDDPEWLAREQAEMRGGAPVPRTSPRTSPQTAPRRGSIYPPGWEANSRQ